MAQARMIVGLNGIHRYETAGIQVTRAIGNQYSDDRVACVSG